MNYLIRRMLDDLENGLKDHDLQKFIMGKPLAVSEEDKSAGMLIVKPVSTDIKTITTGIRDTDNYSVQIILVLDCKKFENQSAVEVTGDSVGMRIMEGRDETTGELLTNTVRYIVRNNYRSWGIKQDDLNIIYDSAEFPEDLDCYTATMSLTIESQTTQSIA